MLDNGQYKILLEEKALLDQKPIDRRERDHQKQQKLNDAALDMIQAKKNLGQKREREKDGKYNPKKL